MAAATGSIRFAGMMLLGELRRLNVAPTGCGERVINGVHAGEITAPWRPLGTVTKPFDAAVIDDPVYVEEEKELVP